MRRSARTSTRTTLQLETFEERIAPAHLGLGALHAEMAQQHAAILSRLHGRLHASHLQHHHAQASMISGHAHKLSGARFAFNATQNATHNAPGSARGSDSPTAPVPAVSMAAPVTPAVADPATPSPVPVHPVTPAPEPVGTTSNLPASLPANAGNILNTIYQEYQKYKTDGGTGTFTSSWSPFVVIQGSDVRVDVHGNGSGDFGSLVSALQDLGMQVTATDSVTQTVEGMLPVDQLPTVAQESHTLSVTPSFRPVLA